MSLSRAKGYQFVMVNAFSQDTFGGNPAAVLILDSMQLSTDTLSGIGRNFNQPMTAVVSPSIVCSEDETMINFDIRYFAPSGDELPLCGHATLAAAKAVLEYSESMDVAKVKVVQFRTISGALLTARKVEGDEEWFEISLPVAKFSPLSTGKAKEIAKIIARALGRESIQIKFAARGAEDFFSHYLLVELGEKEDLAGTKFDVDILKETGFKVNVMTVESTSSEAVYHTRMFAPSVGIGEDHVCGSANCLMGPYWAEKKGLGSGEMKVRQVSARGGNIRVACQDGVVRLRGQAIVTGKGEIYVG